MSYDPYAQFLEVMSDLASARRGLDFLLLQFRREEELYGGLAIRIRDRVGVLPNVGVMVEASFRLLKYVQHGDYANQRDASNLWVEAALRLPAGRGAVLDAGTGDDAVTVGTDPRV